MDRNSTGLDSRRQAGLNLSSDGSLAREKAREAERAAYRRSYWQRYAQTVKRVFGTLSPTEYSETKSRADAHDRSIWAQIWEEAQAYRENAFLPTPEIERNQRQLLGELDRVNQHLGLLVKLGHVQAGDDGMLTAPDNDGVGAQTLKQIDMLKAALRRFMKAPIAPDANRD